MKQLTLPSIIAWLKAHQPLLLTTHVVPDGDGLGSEAGLYYFLRSKGLDVQIFNEHAVHAKFSLLDADDDFQSIAQKSKLSVRPRGVVVVDTHDWSRIGRVGPMLTEAGGTFDVLYLDHHVLDSAHASDKKSSAYMREEACATGELVYDVIEHWQKADGESMADVSKAAMLGVYVALVTDTGAFQFRRTTPRTHEMAAACIRQGVQPYEVQQSLFGSGTYQKLLFEAEALSQTKISSCGRIAYLALPLKLQEKYAMAV
jgi:phosphoesterase RecJ-like protein